MPPESTRRVTRADVARLAGVSPAVVSFTLNGGPRRVAPNTARRVHDAVAQLGYTPNAAARALTTGMSDVIGLVVHDITTPLGNRIMATVQDAADANDISVIVASTLGETARTLQLLRTLDARQMSGIIMTTHLSREEIAAAALLRTPIVQLESDGPVPDVARLHADMGQGTAEAVQHLLALGHERIAYLGGSMRTGARIEAWQRTHREHGLEPGPLLSTPSTRAGGREGMHRLLTEHAPTAVLAGSDSVAVGALRAMHEAGRRVPEDVSLISIGDTEDVEYTTPSLTSVHVPIAEMARDAVHAILDPASMSNETRHYSTRLVVRESTAPPRR